ncbi:MAG: GGDEF domain-containing protein [Candidatus Competibacteraceae bacterium]|nr:GGDEF domain-containing protein [Candidatus Competibacteraceae bacterium]
MKILFRLGQLNSILLITGFATIVSPIVTLIVCRILQLLGWQIDLWVAVFIAVLVPLIVAPLVSWQVMELLFKIYHLERKMRGLAVYDSLTGFLRRHFLFQNAAVVLKLAKRENKTLCVLAIDLDHFKQINDRYGHAAGDEVLKSFAFTVRTVLRGSDLVGRIGGEEFIVVLPGASTENALHLAEHLHAHIKESIVRYGEYSIDYTVSIGLASSSKSETESIETLFSQADKALYLSKKNGRNRTSIFTGC